mmetsp:Transcript_7277/g.7434  ORF Transcript_7277/g.7434 Transcript_7277/m.7434 type:complete len:94 (+) Transcript_7277:411-692(+)
MSCRLWVGKTPRQEPEIGRPRRSAGPSLHASDLTDDSASIVTTGTLRSSSVYIQGRRGEITKLQKLDNGNAVYYPDLNQAKSVHVMYVWSVEC